jgi:hypothetical protein
MAYGHQLVRFAQTVGLYTLSDQSSWEGLPSSFGGSALQDTSSHTRTVDSTLATPSGTQLAVDGVTLKVALKLIGSTALVMAFGSLVGFSSFLPSKKGRGVGLLSTGLCPI